MTFKDSIHLTRQAIALEKGVNQIRILVRRRAEESAIDREPPVERIWGEASQDELMQSARAVFAAYPAQFEGESLVDIACKLEFGWNQYRRGDVTLNDVLTTLGYGTRQASGLYRRTVVEFGQDMSASTVFAGRASEVWEWLRRAGKVPPFRVPTFAPEDRKCASCGGALGVVHVASEDSVYCVDCYHADDETADD